MGSKWGMFLIDEINIHNKSQKLMLERRQCQTLTIKNASVFNSDIFIANVYLLNC